MLPLATKRARLPPLRAGGAAPSRKCHLATLAGGYFPSASAAVLSAWTSGETPSLLGDVSPPRPSCAASPSSTAMQLMAAGACCGAFAAGAALAFYAPTSGLINDAATGGDDGTMAQVDELDGTVSKASLDGEEGAEAVTGLIDWLGSHGIRVARRATDPEDCSSVAMARREAGADLLLTRTAGRGASVVLPSGASDGGTIASVPRDAIVDISTLSDPRSARAPRYFRDWIRSVRLGDKKGQWWPSLTERRVMMLYYLLEGGEDPHLRTFPSLPPRGGLGHSRSFDRAHIPPLPPLFWTGAEQRRLLRGTELCRPLKAKEDFLKRERNDIMRGWVVELTELRRLEGAAGNAGLGLAGSVREGNDEEEQFRRFCWADSLFWTRALQYDVIGDGEEKDRRRLQQAATYHWVPLVDSCNHSHKPNCRWVADERGNVQSIYTPSPPSSFSAASTRERGECRVEKQSENEEGGDGVELCYDYGEKSNAELLFSHGFAVENNSCDEVTWLLLPSFSLSSSSLLTSSLSSSSFQEERDEEAKEDERYKHHNTSNVLQRNLTPQKVHFLRDVLRLPPRICLRRRVQELDFDVPVLGHFDLDSIYVLFLLSLLPEELVLEQNRLDGRQGDPAISAQTISSARCCIDNLGGIAVTTAVESFDDFEEFVDDHCDVLLPRVVKLLAELLEERKCSLENTIWPSSLHLPQRQSARAKEVNLREEGFVHFLLEGQAQLVRDATNLVT